MHGRVCSRISVFLIALVVGCAAAANEPQVGASAQSSQHAPAFDPASATPTATTDVASSGDAPAAAASAAPEATTEPYEFPSGLLVSGEYREPASGVPAETTVLHIGDSFAGALGIDLNKVLKAHGVRGYLKFKVPSYIPGWASGKELPQYLAKYKPDLVLVTLGANEMEISDPGRRAPTIRKLAQRIGDTPCVWIAPALWGTDNGLLEIIRRNVAPCRYLDTNAIVQRMPRAGDKIHPNMNVRPDWAELVLRWLARERVGSTGKPWALRAEPGASG